MTLTKSRLFFNRSRRSQIISGDEAIGIGASIGPPTNSVPNPTVLFNQGNSLAHTNSCDCSYESIAGDITFANLISIGSANFIALVTFSDDGGNTWELISTNQVNEGSTFLTIATYVCKNNNGTGTVISGTCDSDPFLSSLGIQSLDFAKSNGGNVYLATNSTLNQTGTAPDSFDVTIDLGNLGVLACVGLGTASFDFNSEWINGGNFFYNIEESTSGIQTVPISGAGPYEVQGLVVATH